MSWNLTDLLAGLDLDQEKTKNLLSDIENGADEEAIVDACKAYPDPLYLDSYEAAGRILLYVVLRLAPVSIKDYLSLHSHRFNPTVSRFLQRNAAKLDQLIKANFHKNANFDIVAAGILEDKYLSRRAYNLSPAEFPIHMFLRISIQLHHKFGIERVIKSFHELSNQQLSKPSPAIFNSGKGVNPKKSGPQLSSCFLLRAGDNTESLAREIVGDVAEISGRQGGVGIVATDIRSSEIGDSGPSSGPCPFISIYNATIKAFNQRELRSGAANLFCDMYNKAILEFIRCTDQFQNHADRIDRADTTIWVPDLFMERCIQDGPWTVFCPAKTPELKDKYREDFEIAYTKLEKEAVAAQELYNRESESLKQTRKSIRNGENSRLLSMYHEMEGKLISMSKKLIPYKIYRARDLLEEAVRIQISSSHPFVMFKDSVNAKCNMMNIGYVAGSNLCTEITQPSTEHEISSCNLSAVSLKAFVRGKVNWRQISTLDLPLEFRRNYDFDKLGEITRSGIESINRMIDETYYPLDERDEDGTVIVRGKISKVNLRDRPCGLGVSGFFDAVANMDLVYSEYPTEVLNKMIFACMYFNALCKSVELAIREGAYESFLTGTSKIYDAESGKFKTYSGSPISNGFLQFDLWQADASYKRKKGRLREDIYNSQDDIPLDPTEWGQKPYSFTVDEVSYVIEPTWADLKRMIKEYGVRNSMLLTIMPTASSAQLLGNTESVEGHQTLLYWRQVIHGSYRIVVKQLGRDLKEMDMWNEEIIEFISLCGGSIKALPVLMDIRGRQYDRERLDYLIRKYKTMYEISPMQILKLARQRGIYICQSQSQNLYISDPTKEEIVSYLIAANHMGVKTALYYLRQSAGSEQGKFTMSTGMQQIALEYQEEIEKVLGHPLSGFVKQERISNEGTPQEEDDGPVCRMEPGCMSCQG